MKEEELEPKPESKPELECAGYPPPEYLAPMGGLIGLNKAIKQLIRRIAIAAAIIGIGITVAIIVAILYGHPY